MEFEMQATFVLTIINIILLLILGWIYGTSWLKIKSSFTTGLLMFTLIFLLQNLTSFYFYVTEMPYFVDMVSMHVLILTSLQTLALVIMVAISWK